ncbi:MAG: hypothetical protein AAF913_13010 [Pseudomonadota bacterium]
MTLRSTLLAVVAVACLAGCGGGPGIYDSCLASERSPGVEACTCSATLANAALSRRDRRHAARIIAEPDLFLEYQRQASRQAFLDRYRAWGEAVDALCDQEPSGP